jgi:hypothetical protein
MQGCGISWKIKGKYDIYFTLFQKSAAEVCMKPGLALGTSAEGLGLSLVVQIMFRPGVDLGLVQMIVIKCHIQHFGLSWAILLNKEKVIHICAYLLLVTQSGSKNKSHQLNFLRDFHRCPFPEIAQDNILQNLHPIFLYHSSYAKITSDVHSRITGILCFQRKMC